MVIFIILVLTNATVFFACGFCVAVYLAYPRVEIKIDALNEIKSLAETSDLESRWGARRQACDTTCLIECGQIAKRAIELHNSPRYFPGPLFPARNKTAGAAAAKDPSR
jgi:hypothetical protein